MSKTATSFRLSDEARRLLVAISEKMGISQASTVEAALRLLAAKMGDGMMTNQQGETNMKYAVQIKSKSKEISDVQGGWVTVDYFDKKAPAYRKATELRNKNTGNAIMDNTVRVQLKEITEQEQANVAAEYEE